jgi:CheY-like chemotaxis protein
MMMISDHLSGVGYDVLEAANAERAVDELEGDDSIGAMFTDVQLPGSMNGLHLAQLVHWRWPLVRVLVTSGSDRYGPADMGRGDTFFRKPYLPEDVARALRAA